MDFDDPLHLLAAALIAAAMILTADAAIRKEESLYRMLLKSLGR